MKHLSFPFLLVILFTTNAVSQNPQPTLDETISWIEGKLNFSYKQPIIGTGVRTSVKFDRVTKTLLYSVTYIPNNKPNQNTKTFIPMKAINPNNIRVQEYEGDFWVHIYTNNNKYDIKWESLYENEDPSKKLVTTHNTVSFHIPNAELEATPDFANRLKTALAHLIKLCCGKGEQF